MIRFTCIANAVYVTVLSTQQAALLNDIGSPHGELETSIGMGKQHCSGPTMFSVVARVLRTTCFNARTLTATYIH